MMKTDAGNEARQRCLRYRRKILDISQHVMALHIAPAFSCMELVDAIYGHLMRCGADGAYEDAFLMSKGHGCMAQYVMLAERGILSEQDLADYCTPQGRLGAHPDYGTPGIEAATGSLGHGMAMGVGMAQADRIKGLDRTTYLVLSDGELQEGSSWEAMMCAANLELGNLVACLDLNDRQSMDQTSESHPAFYPVLEKAEAFGWETVQVNGHNFEEITAAVENRKGGKPFFLIGKTVKGRGVSYMENVPIWHYRAPSPEEYDQAVAELVEIDR